MINIETRRAESLEERILSKKNGERILQLNDQNMNRLRDVMMESMINTDSSAEIVRLLNAAKGFTDALSQMLSDGDASNIELVEKVLKSASSLLRQKKIGKREAS